MSESPMTMAAHELAADWYLRRQSGDWSAADEAAFDAWLRADPGNEFLYRQLAQTWQDFSAIARPRLASDAQRGRADHRLHARWQQHLSLLWRPALVAACLVVAVGAWQFHGRQPEYREEVATAREQRVLDLPDGTRIVMNAGSALEVRLYADRREIAMRRGEAFFEVAHAPDRPFTVLAGSSEIRVVGTVFDVQMTDPQLQVKVRSGRVEVRPDKDVRDQLTVLKANEAIAINAHNGEARRFEVVTEMVGDWRAGQLVFRATPLASVAATLTSYIGQPIVLTDAGLASWPVSGYVSTASPAAFVGSLPNLMAVKVERSAAGGYRISPR